MLIAWVLAGAAFASARRAEGFRELLAGGGEGATRPGWVVFGTVSAWLAVLVLGTFVPHGDAKANDVATRLRGRAAGDGWVLITSRSGVEATEEMVLLSTYSCVLNHMDAVEA